VTDRNGQPWLRVNQIGLALGYKNPELSTNKLYRANAAEFTDNMTALVKLPTSGGEQETRIFSLRGAHLLGMFARTPVAAEFRRWVLDILDDELERMRDAVLDAQAPKTPVAPSDRPAAGYVWPPISAEQYKVVEQLIAERRLPGDLRERFVARLAWNYRVEKLTDLPERHFTNALLEILRHPCRSPVQESERPPAKLPAPAVPAVAAGPRPFGGAETAWLTRFDCHNVGHAEQVPADSFIFRVSELPDLLREPGGHVPRKMLPSIINACVARLS